MRRLVSILLAAVTTAAIVGTPPASAAPTPAGTAEAEQGATWLAGQLSHGRIHNAQYDFDDWGLTLDTLFALQASGTRRGKVAEIETALQTGGVDAYATSGNPASLSAGALAKLLVAAEALGASPKTFGGRDLIADVEGRMTAATGRVKDKYDANDPYGGDYANTIGQAFAVQGLSVAYSKSTDKATSFLLRQQCKRGYFRLEDNDGKTCDAAAGEADTDATSYAVQALIVAGAHGVGGTKGALRRASRWLASSQDKDGSHGGGVSTAAPNANSTALAATALAQLGKTSKARRAAGWVKSLQVTKAVGGELAGEVGAVAYDATSFNAGRSSGVTEDARDQWRRTTTQAVVALAAVQAPPRAPVAAPAPASTPAPAPAPAPAPKQSTAPKPAAKPVPPVAAAPVEAGTSTPGGALGRYLATQLAGGTHVEVAAKGKTYVDYGLTADAVLALRVLHEQPKAADSGTAFLLAPGAVKAYVSGAPYDTAGASYAEPLAKLIWIASLARDRKSKALAASLAARLEGLQQPDGTFSDRGRNGDGSADVERQAWATMALAATNRSQAADLAASRLRAAQCADGTFPKAMTGACSSGDRRATGAAMQALAARADGSADLDALVKAADALRPVPIEDQGDFGSVASIAAGRQAVGLDPSRAADYLGKSELASGGLPAHAGLKVADLSTSLSAAPGIAGRSIVTASGSPVTTDVALPLADTTPPVRAPSAPSDTSSHDPLIYTGLGVLLAIIAFGFVQLARRWFARPRKAVHP